MYCKPQTPKPCLSYVTLYVTYEWSRFDPLVLLSPPKPDFAKKRSGAQKFLAPSGALLFKRNEVASSYWRATERPLYEKVETTPEKRFPPRSTRRKRELQHALQAPNTQTLPVLCHPVCNL